MKRLFMLIALAVVVAGLTGCRGQLGCLFGNCSPCPTSCSEGISCDACDDSGCGSCAVRPILGCNACGGHGCGACAVAAPAAPPTYPYYTNRGPRDFLVADPPSIGP